MKNINLSNDDAELLINILKRVLKKHQIDIKPGNKGNINLKSTENEFILDYFTSKLKADKISIHLREKQNNISLVRINIDPNGFHKNADGSMVKGNRLLLFSNNEYFLKDDGFTHVRAFEVPKQFINQNDLEQVFLDFLLYINVKQEGKISFAPLF